MFRNLLAEMARNNLTKKDLSEKLGVHYDTVYRKFNNKGEWTRSEMFKISDMLNKDVDYLFQKGGE